MYSRKTFILIAIATFFAVSCSKSIEYETFTYCQEGSQTDVNVNINIYVKVPKAGQSVALDSVRAAMTDFFAKNCSTDLQKCLETYVEEIKDNAGVDMSFPDDEMALLFDCSTDNISLHLKNIYKEEELNKEATTEKSSVVQKEGDRQVTRPIKSCWTMTFPCSGPAASIPMRT